MAATDILFTPGTIGSLTLKNRFVSTAHEPAYGVGGRPLERYRAYLEERAAGGAAMVMFGGSAMVSASWPPSFGQLDLSDDGAIEPLSRLSERIHRHGAHTMVQLSHPGRRCRFDGGNWMAPLAPGPWREAEHRSAPKLVEPYEIDMIRDDYANAASRCARGGLDGVEVMVQGGQLLNAFLSPDTNALEEPYGGSPEARLRMVREVLRAIRDATPAGFVVGVRLAGDEFVEGGMDQRQCLDAAVGLAETGLIDYLNVIGVRAGDLISGFLAIPNMSFRSAPYLYLPSAIRAAVDLPVLMAQKIADPQTAARAVAGGHVDFVGVNRALMADPHFVNKLRDGKADDIRLCVGANYCIDRIYVGGDALCIQNAATGRETQLPHRLRRASKRKRAAIVGGGPGGLEAARVCAERGHDVVLFEAQERLGGQILLASRAAWRKPLGQIPVWLESRLRKFGVDVRTGREASAGDVAELDPDLVVIATGGRPFVRDIPGAVHLSTAWETHEKTPEPSGSVLVYDDWGGHPALAAAEIHATLGDRVEYVTPHRTAGAELGGTNIARHLANLHSAGALVATSQRLVRVYPEGNRLVAVLRHEYSLEEEERVVDRVVAEYGTLPVAELFFALKDRSRNRGELDYAALRERRPQERRANPDGRFDLFRIGDAVSQRNVHAAIHDALRLLKDL